MSDIGFKSVIHRGNVRAAGFILLFDLVGEAEARRRILANWKLKATVYRLKNGLVLVLPETVLISVDAAVGLPLVWNERVLTALPLSKQIVSGVSGSLAYLDGGRLISLSLTALPAERLETWINVAAFRFEAGISLGVKPVTPSAPVQEVPAEIRKTLGGLPEMSPEARAFVERLKGGAGGRQGGERMGTSLGRTMDFLRSLFRTKARSEETTVTTSRLALWLNSIANRVTMITRLSKLIGWQHARYMARVLAMFESGDIREALRHAIPLGAISETPAFKSFRLLSPRRSLSVNPRRTTGGGISFGQGVHQYLEALYRRTVQQLEAQGRIEEAAFVLAELLRADEEAVAFLERHGKLRQAAELAEGRGLSPDVVVRQWYVAGEKQRAIWIARQTGAFHAAITRLEASNPQLAAALRKEWAQLMAEMGNVAAAVDTLWPLESERRSALDWMKQAVTLGGLPGARNLARLVAISPVEGDAFWDQALALLRNDSAEDAANRAEFAETVCAQTRSPHTQTIARAAARAMLRDAGQGLQSLDAAGIRSVVEYAQDGALRADVPQRIVSQTTLLRRVTKPIQYVVTAPQTGSIEIHEAVSLPSGRFALALGEAGLRIIGRDGRKIFHVDQPAYRIVSSDNGSTLIGVAPRGRTSMLFKLDLLSRRATPWCVASINAFASKFDGGCWYVMSEQDLYAIDAISSNFDSLWRIPELGPVVGPITLTWARLSFVTWSDSQLWLWEFQMPSLRLQGKFPLENVPEEAIGAQFTATGEGNVWTALAAHAVYFQLRSLPWEKLVALGPDEFVRVPPMVNEAWMTLVIQGPNYARVTVYSIENKKIPVLRFEVLFDGKVQPVVRLDNSRLTIAYSSHVLSYELTYGTRTTSCYVY